MKKVLLLLLGGGLLIAGCSHFQGVRNAQEVREGKMERIDLLNSCEGGTRWTFGEDGIFRLECIPRVFYLYQEFSRANQGIQGGGATSGSSSTASAAATAAAGPAAPGNAPGSAPASGPSAPASAGPAAPAGGQGGSVGGSPGVGK